MTLIVLTEENCTAAKAALHDALPAIRSSHLAEAMAAGLGYRTHAALRSDMKAHIGLHPPLADGDDMRFVARLEELGYRKRVPSHFENAFSAEILPDIPYVFATKYHRAAADGRHFICRERGWPMMAVKMARHYATLEWDCITIDTSEEAHVQGREADDVNLVRRMYDLFQERVKGGPGNPYFYGSAFVGDIKKLVPNTARQLAEDYFRLLYQPMNEQRMKRQEAA